jgi:hypothetical protein
MKRSLLRVMTLGAVMAFSVAPSRAAEDAETLKLKRIEEEVAKRRKLRESALENRGVAFTPVLVLESWFSEEMDFRIEDQAIGTCCQTFATLARKEVLASSGVVKKRISIAAGRVDGETALRALREAIEAQGVRIVPIGDRILVLVDAADVANENKG